MSDPPYVIASCDSDDCDADFVLPTCENCEGTGTVRYCSHGILENEWCPKCPSGGV